MGDRVQCVSFQHHEERISGSRGDQESTVYGRTRGRLLPIKGTDANHRQLHCRLLFGDEKVVQNLDARFVDWTGTETESVRYLCRSKEEEIERDGQKHSEKHRKCPIFDDWQCVGEFVCFATEKMYGGHLMHKFTNIAPLQIIRKK